MPGGNHLQGNMPADVTDYAAVPQRIRYHLRHAGAFTYRLPRALQFRRILPRAALAAVPLDAAGPLFVTPVLQQYVAWRAVGDDGYKRGDGILIQWYRDRSGMFLLAFT